MRPKTANIHTYIGYIYGVSFVYNKKKMYFSGKVILIMNLLYLLAVNSLKNFPILYYLQDPLHSIRNEYGPHVQLLQQKSLFLNDGELPSPTLGRARFTVN